MSLSELGLGTSVIMVHQLFVVFKKKWDESPLLRFVAGLFRETKNRKLTKNR
jgi:hypothetical protein